MNTKTYGNPSRDIIHLANQPTFLDGLFTWAKDYLKFAYPESDQTKMELAEANKYVTQLYNDTDLQQRFSLYDKSLFTYISNFTFPHNDNLTQRYKEVVNMIFSDVWPLIYKLKLHFQRPRPFQLAAMHNIELYPLASLSSHCPAFPSMHSCMGMILFYVIGNIFPETYQMFKDLSNDIGRSRVYMGLCLISDMDAGIELATRIMQEKEFKIKYRL